MTTKDHNLKYCPTRNQMTNHLNGVCQKCANVNENTKIVYIGDGDVNENSETVQATTKGNEWLLGTLKELTENYDDGYLLDDQGLTFAQVEQAINLEIDRRVREARIDEIKNVSVWKTDDGYEAVRWEGTTWEFIPDRIKELEGNK